MEAGLRDSGPPARRDALAVLARGRPAELRAAWDALPGKPSMETIRPPETGLVMARGRIGGGGAPFSLGELTVTRAVVRSETGRVGFAHVLGRDREHALLTAQFDALWQDETWRAAVESSVIAPVRARLEAEDSLKALKVASTRVNFFTLVRGDDE